ncbi:MAG: hypothetical protein KJ970_02330 [Candidatus Eisenbacteria bacterium]|uniref:Uncharacterized protein n=1 Tax=Eiseniibacteriota bacterium TaxID=2212470 RepID=A0A948RRN3_UNCEI|nr:hypothetical protein [Candidatus Eisenbacteria bacterium]
MMSKTKMQAALTTLTRLLEENKLTAGMSVIIHGDHLILRRSEVIEQGTKSVNVDLVRLTRLNASRYGLSVRRHNGRWERMPFSGSIKEMVSVMQTFMQHLVAPR